MHLFALGLWISNPLISSSNQVLYLGLGTKLLVPKLLIWHYCQAVKQIESGHYLKKGSIQILKFTLMRTSDLLVRRIDSLKKVLLQSLPKSCFPSPRKMLALNTVTKENKKRSYSFKTWSKSTYFRYLIQYIGQLTRPAKMTKKRWPNLAL